MAAKFDKEMEEHQVAWRARRINYSDQGRQNKVSRPWLLPEKRWEDGLWPGIRSVSPNSLPDYLEQAAVQKHQHRQSLVLASIGRRPDV